MSDALTSSSPKQVQEQNNSTLSSELQKPQFQPSSPFADKSLYSPSKSPLSPLTQRCSHCNKKISVVPFSCRCGLKFCVKDKLPENHNCTFDWKAAAKKELAEKNPKIVASKITFI